MDGPGAMGSPAGDRGGPGNVSGAIDLTECPEWGSRFNCACEKCAHCGFRKHMAVHGPTYGQPPGSKPYDHEFVPQSTGDPNP